ncbi:DNase I-like protein [Lentinus brumalis]|uniref:DNase I-like protein n=1 Tax=Lentinus brumalis TaxID=2498619 RepID=A0A371DW49_9APHY|nr:DNase I-like protein [Polyporus brumalis]
MDPRVETMRELEPRAVSQISRVRSVAPSPGRVHCSSTETIRSTGRSDAVPRMSDTGEAGRRRPRGTKLHTKSKLTIASLNMRGYGRLQPGQATDKWMTINQVIRDSKIAVLALQETHLTEERVCDLNTLFGATMKVIAYADGDNPTGARGVAFALNKRLVNTEDVSVYKLLPGRALAIRLLWTGGRKLSILNIYAPNHMQESLAFWDSVSDELTTRRVPSPDVMLGDMNVVEHALDRLPVRRDPDDTTAALTRLLTRLQLIDGWRMENQGRRGFTYLQASTGSQSRLDRIYLKQELLNYTSDWKIEGAGIPTDHRMPMVAIANYNEPHVGKGRWALPAALLSDKLFLDLMKTEGLELQQRLLDLKERTVHENPQLIWSAFKEKLRDCARKRAKSRIPKLDRQIQCLNEDLRATLDDPSGVSPEQQSHAAILQDRIAALEITRFGSKRARVNANDFLKGETISKYWTRQNAPARKAARRAA